MIQQIDQLLAGTADLNGSFDSGTLKPVPTLWGALMVVAQTSGSAKWTILVGGAPKAFGRGERIGIPVLVQPAQSLEIQVTGASAGATVSGNITGVGGSTLDEVTPYISLVPNTIALDAAPVQHSTLIAQGTGGFGTGGVGTFRVQIVVVNANVFQPGDTVEFISNPTVPATGSVYLAGQVVAVANDGVTVTVVGVQSGSHSINPGDLVRLMDPNAGLFSAGLVGIVQSLPPLPTRPPDWEGIGSGSPLTLSVVPPGGQRVVVNEAVFSFFGAAGAVASGITPQISDGTVQWQQLMGITGPGVIDHVYAHLVKGAVGNTVTIGFNAAAPANTNVAASASGWFV